MPIPLRPNGTSPGTSKEPSAGYLPIDPTFLSDQLLSVPQSFNKKASVSDKDATLLFSLWEASSMVRDAKDIADRVYRLPDDFRKEDIMRLRTSGFLMNRGGDISFTKKAEEVIKNIVLSEGNKLREKSVKKPYSVILAEMKSPKRSAQQTFTSRSAAVQDGEGEPVSLAFVSADGKERKELELSREKDGFQTWEYSGAAGRPHTKATILANSPTLKVAAEALRARATKLVAEGVYSLRISAQAAPGSGSKYIWSKRLVNTNPGHNKEYTVRVYDVGGGKYEVWGFNGRIDGTQVPRYKASYSNDSSAKVAAQEIVYERTHRGGSDQYNPATDEGYPAENKALPGSPAGSSPSKPVVPPKPVQKATPSKPVVPPKPAPKPAEDTALIHSIVDDLMEEKPEDR